MAPPESLSPSGVALACVLRNATSDNDVVSTAAPDSITNEEETSYVAFRNWISSGSPDKMKPGPPTNASSILCLLFEKSMAPLRLPATALDKSFRTGTCQQRKVRTTVPPTLMVTHLRKFKKKVSCISDCTLKRTQSWLSCCTLCSPTSTFSWS